MIVDYLLNLDKQLLLLLNNDCGAFWDFIFYSISYPWTWVPLYLTILYIVYRRVGWKQALLFFAAAVVAIAIADQTCNFFKMNVPKFRPTHNPEIQELVHTVYGYRGGLYGTVSGHAANSFALATLSALVLKNKYWTIGLMSWATLVIMSRIYLGAHFPLDVIFGTMLGIAVGYFANFIYKTLTRKIIKTNSI